MISSEGPCHLAPGNQVGPAGMASFTMLRSPRARYKSHYDHHMRQGSCKKTPPSGKCDFLSWMSSVPDNWMTRQFCGEICESVPFGQLNSTHLNLAVDGLNRLDAVLILEMLSELTPLLQFVTGWKVANPGTHHHQSAANAKAKSAYDVEIESRPNASREFDQSIRAMTQLDHELFLVAQSISLHQLRVLREAGLASGLQPARRPIGCKSQCCTSRMEECGTMSHLWKLLNVWHKQRESGSIDESKILFDAYHGSRLVGLRQGPH